MGEYVKASLIRPGDYVSTLGHGFMDRLVMNITGDHQRRKVNDGPWEDQRCINIQMGTPGKGITDQMLVDPDYEVYRTHLRPTVTITDDDLVIVNGIPSGKIALAADVRTHEYHLKHDKREIIGGPTGYAWKSYSPDGEFRGQAISYDECLENMIHIAIREQAKVTAS